LLWKIREVVVLEEGHGKKFLEIIVEEVVVVPEHLRLVVLPIRLKQQHSTPTIDCPSHTHHILVLLGVGDIFAVNLVILRKVLMSLVFPHPLDMLFPEVAEMLMLQFRAVSRVLYQG
jgi:hypothetical protein